jgi:hypothetical protein
MYGHSTCDSSYELGEALHRKVVFGLVYMTMRNDGEPGMMLRRCYEDAEVTRKLCTAL